jgi:ABC-type dipeptide/oligopeptide/nickel transport system permease subunit
VIPRKDIRNAVRALARLRELRQSRGDTSLPTLLIVGGLDFAMVILAESALSFLGMGIQPPDITWGLMVSDGRPYVGSAWWLSFWPGLMIVLTALCANILASWFRSANDPTLRGLAPQVAANG